MAESPPGNKPTCFSRVTVAGCVVLLLATALALAFLDQFPLADAAGQANPRADLWREVRQGVAGYSAVTGPETGVLIQDTGQPWRQFRNGPLAISGAWIIFATTAALSVFYWIRGPVKLSEPRSGKTVLRWTLGERILHWYTAILFVILGVTGFSLLYGRHLLIPLVGKSGFSAYAAWAKLLHNFLGPAFIVGLTLMFAAWARHNVPNRLDLEWFKSFGGMIGRKHPSAERINAGEKAWFWLLIVAGLGVSVSGLILDFPNFGQTRFAIQASHLLHASLAVILVSGALGHIYIGSIGTEGALEGMTRGRVDTTWAKQHHDLWYEELRTTKIEEPPDANAGYTPPRTD